MASRIRRRTGFLWNTWRCNLNCAYCDQKRVNGPVITEEVMDAALNWFRSNRFTSVNLFGAEPFTNPESIKYLLGRGRNIRWSATTNGTLLDDELWDWLRLHDFRVALSFDGIKEIQDRQRDNSYDAVISHMDRWLKITSQPLMTVVEPARLYECVEHIRDLGFKAVFLNLLHPYGHGYDEQDLKDLNSQYSAAVRMLHDPPNFTMGDVSKTAKNIEMRKRQGYAPGCGITRQGYCVDPQGFIYPCHRGPELGSDFAIGSVFNGVDAVAERRVRKEVSVIPEKCKHCSERCLPCPVACYKAHGEFGVDPEDWFCEALKSRRRIVQKLSPPVHATAHPFQPSS